ncbi:Protein phosphatase 1 regulatory subunit 37-like protein [Diplonema papillatum]|nr:Protein phosphatase 1 regulatory subunit 37-like protein [Diplonema papillatum]
MGQVCSCASASSDHHVMERLANNDRSFVRIDFGETDLGDEGALRLAACLRKNACVLSLVLSFSSVGPAGVEALCQSIGRRSPLSTLCLNGNRISDVAPIAALLEQNPCLTYLNLGGNRINAAGMVSLLQALRTNSKLAFLNLGGNDIEIEDPAVIKRELAGNEALLLLDLQGNPTPAPVLEQCHAHFGGERYRAAGQRVSDVSSRVSVDSDAMLEKRVIGLQAARAAGKPGEEASPAAPAGLRRDSCSSHRQGDPSTPASDEHMSPSHLLSPLCGRPSGLSIRESSDALSSSQSSDGGVLKSPELRGHEKYGRPLAAKVQSGSELSATTTAVFTPHEHPSDAPMSNPMEEFSRTESSAGVAPGSPVAIRAAAPQPKRTLAELAARNMPPCPQPPPSDASTILVSALSQFTLRTSMPSKATMNYRVDTPVASDEAVSPPLPCSGFPPDSPGSESSDSRALSSPEAAPSPFPSCHNLSWQLCNNDKASSTFESAQPNVS